MPFVPEKVALTPLLAYFTKLIIKMLPAFFFFIKTLCGGTRGPEYIS